MAITDKKISVVYSGRDIASLSDHPNQDGMTATNLKARFDQLGKEVIPNFNDLIDELNGILNDTAQRIDNIVTTPVPVGEIIAQEIIDARQGALSLGENITDIKSQLAQSTQKIHTNTTNIAIHTSQIISLGSGSPKGIYATVSDLTTAYPTGNTNIYVVTADGNWYYWNGTIWTPGGIYQSTGIMDGSIDESKTSFIQAGKNLFDKTKGLFEQFLNTSNVLSVSVTYNVSDYIKISANTNYVINKCRDYVFYDTNKNFVSGVDNGSLAPLVINNTSGGYVRFSYFITDINTTQFELGNTPTSYENYGYTIDKLSFTDKQKKSLAIGNLKLIKSGDNFDFTSKFDSTQDITISTKRNGSANGSFNFLQTKVGVTNIHTTTDDITPIRTFTTVGANHGYTSIIKITMASHGKTNADLGSQWTDGTTVYTLLTISGNDLFLGCPYTVIVDIVSSSYIAPLANLTHVSGATNTANISITTVVASPQLYPSINNISVKYILDGNEITEDGTFYGNELQIQESYNIMDYKAIIDFAQANIGVSYVDGNIIGVVKISNTFTYTNGLKCTTSHALTALKKQSFLQCGFLQSVAINPLSGHTRKRFMPNVLPKSGFNFASGVDLDTYATSLLFTDADYVTPTIPPNHYIDWLYDGFGNKAYGFTMGYIVDKTNSKNSDRLANTVNGWDMRNSKKSYPNAIEGITLQAGQRLNFEGFRNYVSPVEVGEATNLTIVKDRKDTYIYIDMNKISNGLNKQLHDAIGKSVYLIQNENLTLLNDTVDSDGIVFNATSVLSNGIIKVN